MKRQTTKLFPIVGIGASAGGFEAFKDLLRNLPTKTGMAFILIQHLDPKYESSLARLLARASSMPVVEAHDGLRIKRDTVYVMPENVNMTIDDGSLHLTPRDSSTGLHHPIDFFFESLAKSHYDNAVGIVLSGTGSDGAIGLRAIKTEGGITLAQDEKSATFPEMPRNAVNAGAVDLVLPLEKMAKEIVKLFGDRSKIISNTGERSEPEIDQFYRQICEILEKSGFDFFSYKPSVILRRISRRMILSKQPDLRQYMHNLRRNPEEVSALIEDLLIHVTNFFRDPEKYELLVSVVLPKMLKYIHPEERFRVWIAGCSSGEEVYSTAIVLLEFLASKKKMPNVQIFGTDISERLIERARYGVYPKSIEGHISRKRLNRFFDKLDGAYQIKKSVKEVCVFSQHDLLKNPPFSRMDIISCCNLLIYFRPEIQNKVLSTFHHSLKPSGVLILGKSETTAGLPGMFEPVDKKQRVYLKKLHPTVKVPLPQIVPHYSTLRDQKPKPVFDLEKAADKAALERYSHAGLLVDEQMKIVQFRGPVARFLEPSSGQASLDLMKMIHQKLRLDLRSLFLVAKKKLIPVRRENLSIEIDGVSSCVDIEVVPIQDLNTNQIVFLILFIQSDPKIAGLPVSMEAFQKDEDGAITNLQKELEQTKVSCMEELEPLNEELISANEELQSANEELQSKNEEYESTKEELESSNEELMTLNEEIQSRNSELDRMNSEFQEARDFAEAIIKTGRQPLVVLDNKLRIIMANPAFYREFKLNEKDVRNKFFFEIYEDFWDVPDLRNVVKSVLRKDTIFEDFEVEAAFPGIGYRTMILNGRQVQQKNGEDRLILLAFEDITEHKRFAANATMLKEIHHRVKNNLQVIMSLLNLQLNSMDDEKSAKAFQESQNRIQSMALIHEKLYQSNDMDKIEFKEYITDLGEYLFKIYKTASRIVQLKINMKQTQLPIETAVPCGLITSELLSNCLKYAFTGKKSGKITIELKTKRREDTGSPSKYLLSIKDNGIGLPKSVNPKTSSSLGMKIITALTAQIGGEVKVLRHGGTTFQIVFPEKMDSTAT